MRTPTLVAIPWFAVLVPLVACAPPVVDGGGGGNTSAQLSAGLDPDSLMSDDELLGGQDIQASAIENVFANSNSFLSGYEDPTSGETAAEAIIAACQRTGVSPVYMLARIQGESGLVTGGSERDLAAATGCACPDNEPCAQNEAGFTSQVNCAADLVAEYMSDLQGRGYTVSGWSVGASKTTLDGCSVTPQTNATAALYTYTPYVGAYSDDGCGTQSSGGSTGIAHIYEEMAAQF